MKLYICVNIELWNYTAVGTLSNGTIYLCEHKAVEVYSRGNIELWNYTAVGT